jgi:recombination protein RecT
MNTAPESTDSKNISTNVLTSISRLTKEHKLFLPADYSPENALKAAWLILQDLKGRDSKPVLQSCSPASITHALLDMVYQGLNPSKTQCYFIPYGASLTCQRSYFGDMALAERVKPGIEFYWDVVREGEDLTWTKKLGKSFDLEHTGQGIGTLNNSIKAAYCGYILDGKDMGAVVMSIEQIKQAWSMSKTYQEKGNGTHNKFEPAMALRTVIRKCCKPIINSSTDRELLAAVARSENNALEAEFTEEIAQNANQEVLTIDEPVIDRQLVPEPENEGKEIEQGQEATAGGPGY